MVNNILKSLTLLLAVIFLFSNACAPSPAARDAEDPSTETNWDVVEEAEEEPVNVEPDEDAGIQREINDTDELPVFVEVVDESEVVEIKLEIPDIWPEDLPVPQGLELTHMLTGPGDRFNGTVQGTGSFGEMESVFSEAMSDWTARDPWPVQYVVMDTFEMSWYRENETVDIVASSAGSGSMIRMLVTYNFRTPPGQYPDGWPSDLPVMPGMVLSFGFLDSIGGLGTVHTGRIEPEEIAEYYVNSLIDWTSVNPADLPIINMGKLSLNFERDEEKLTLTMSPYDDYYVMSLIWYEYGY